MKKSIITEGYYDIPFNRWVYLNIDALEFDKSSKVLVQIKEPAAFEKTDPLETIVRDDKYFVAIHKRFQNINLHPTTRVYLVVYQETEEIPAQEIKPEKSEEKTETNVDTPKESATIKSFIDKITNWKQKAVEEAQKRKDRLTRIRGDVNEASALKPFGLDGQTIVTGDHVDYTKTVSLIVNLKKLEQNFNKKSNNGESRYQLLSEFVDIVSFSGISSVIGLYIALGNKSKGKGNLDFLLNWFINELSKAYSYTSLENWKKRGLDITNRLKIKKFQNLPNPGFSVKNAEKIIGELFRNEYTGEDFRLKDLVCEIYQPLILDDEQTRVYTKISKPNARLVDVVLDTSLDPLYFQSRKILIANGEAKEHKLSLGPWRRSFDLPIAQYNRNINLISFGVEMPYQESEKNLEGFTQSDLAFYNKYKERITDHLDAKK
ncbi:MAG: hypothetical protein JSU85_03370 [Candidatus Zixiibacteriota bacterium]|nr:MAG: hypothetical protein JSU85_03370 [candidate division Zixibacteria bacterium]